MFVRDIIANSANVVVDGKTVVVFTRHDQDYVASQIINSVDEHQQRTNRLIFKLIRDVFPSDVDGIVYDYAADLDFAPFIKKIQ